MTTAPRRTQSVHRRRSRPGARVVVGLGLASLAVASGLLLATSPAAADVQGPAPAAALASPAAPATPATPLAARAAAARPVLRMGSRGQEVVDLQRWLSGLHYDVGPADGNFGSQTFHGVVAFQKVNGLGRDGIVGAQTWARLGRPSIPRPRFSHSGTWVEVNLSTQVLYLFRGGGVVRIVDASSGTASTPTPTGNFSVIRRIDGWRQSSLGLLWRPNYFFQGYAIHGSTSVPNYPASHGCVRVTIEAMNRLWTVLGIGMPVHVYR